MAAVVRPVPSGKGRHPAGHRNLRRRRGSVGRPPCPRRDEGAARSTGGAKRPEFAIRNHAS